MLSEYNKPREFFWQNFQVSKQGLIRTPRSSIVLLANYLTNITIQYIYFIIQYIFSYSFHSTSLPFFLYRLKEYHSLLEVITYFLKKQIKRVGP